ncbi:MAG TPA: hypothetical protein VFV34_26735 [Blastocatellia bacterium]|nr:hypothetical protein [Blastocatellia bacterium]
MNRRVAIFCVIAALALAGVSGAAAGQEKTERGFAYNLNSDGPAGQFDFQFGGPDGPMVWMMADGKLVKGAPYSAQAVNESIQTLADGNRLVRRSTSTLYRDSEGRTRREESIPQKPGADDQGRTIFINDPVAGVNYVLDTRQKTAHKMSSSAFTVTWSNDGAKGERTITVNGVKPESKGEARVNKVEENVVIERHGGNADHASGETVVSSHSSAAYHMTAKGQKESLGKQMFDGVEAEGTRTTMTIPAGEIGNEQPINIVTERWYSPELQLTVMTRHSDPRFGESTYRLTNINRSEPARALFEPPADFTVSTDLPMKKRKPMQEQ